MLFTVYCVRIYHLFNESLISSLDLPTPPSKIKNMLISTLFTQSLQRLLKLIQIISILSTRSPALHDLLRQCLRILRTQELRIVRQADVHQALDRVRDICWRCVGSRRDGLERCAHVLLVVEGRVLDAVAVDLTDVEVFFHFGYVARGDAVCCAPDSGRSGSVLWATLLLEGFTFCRTGTRMPKTWS